MRTSRINQLAIATTSAVLLLLVAACGGTPESPAAGGKAAGAAVQSASTLDRHDPKASAFYSRFRQEGGLHVEFYKTLAEGVPGATATIVGEVVRVERTRNVHDVSMIGVVLRPVEVVDGELPAKFANELTVEFVGATVDPTGAHDPIAELQQALPKGHQGLWVLRSKSDAYLPGKRGPLPVNDAERDYWRVVSPQGLAVQGQSRVETPLAEEMPGDMAAEARTYQRVSDLVTAVRNLR